MKCHLLYSCAATFTSWIEYEVDANSSNIMSWYATILSWRQFPSSHKLLLGRLFLTRQHFKRSLSWLCLKLFSLPRSRILVYYKSYYLFYPGFTIYSVIYPGGIWVVLSVRVAANILSKPRQPRGRRARDDTTYARRRPEVGSWLPYR